MSTISQRNFSAGEVAPEIYSRVDQTKYQTGLRTLRNAYVMRHGGVTSRSGSQFVCEVLSSAATVRFIPYFFDDNISYFFELGNLYIRRIKDGAYVLEPAANVKTITAVSVAAEAVFTSNSHGYSNDRAIYMAGMLGLTELNGQYLKVSDVTANTYKLKYKDGSYVDSTVLGTYTSLGKTLLVDEVVTAFTTAELSEIRYAQSQAAIIFTHPSHAQSVVVAYNAVVSPAYPGLITAPVSIDISATTSSPTNFTTTHANAGGAEDITWYLTAINDATGEESSAVTKDRTTIAVPSASDRFVFTFTAVSGCTYYNVYRNHDESATAGSGVFGYLTTVTGGFTDLGQWTVDPTRRPPTQLSVLSSTNNYPVCVGILQQRFVFGSSNTNAARLWLSRVGNEIVVTTVLALLSMQRSFPQQDDDAFLFDVIGREFNGIKHILEMELPVIFTGSAEYVLNGNESGGLTPTSINKATISRNGASSVAPVIVDRTALYIQERGQILRDLSIEFEADGYKGNDLTTFAPHLVEDYTVVDMAYQKTPHSIVWLVRSDGVLLSLTYVREQRILGWAKHDFDGGTVENVVCMPEGLEHAVYVLVKRTIATHGSDRTVRYIERLNTRVIDDVRDFVGCDSAVTRDGTNASATTMTISSTTTLTVTGVTKANPGVLTYTGTDPVNGDQFVITGVVGMTELNGNSYRVKNVNTAANTFELTDTSDSNVNTSGYTTYSSGGTATNWLGAQLTVTASSIVGVNLGLDAGQTGANTGLGFSASDVGNAIDFYDSDDVFLVRILIDEYTSTTVVKGRASIEVPSAVRSTATATWGHAKKVVRGLWHLVGEDVSVFADGYVVASPKNSHYTVLTVAANGTLTLADPYVKVHVGLPFISDIETLNVDSDQAESIADKKSIPSKVTMHLQDTRGVFIGPQPPDDDDDDPLQRLEELKIRNSEGYNEPVDLFTGVHSQNIQANWNNQGRVFIRQIDPLPMTVNSIMVAGLFPFQKKGG